MKQFLKNAIPYSLMGETAKLSVDDWSAALEKQPHQLPGPRDLKAFGFIPPLGADLVEQPSAEMMVIALKESYRDLPASVVGEETQKKVDEITRNEGRPVGRKERQSLKDEVIFDLLPQCFIKHRITYALILKDMIIVDNTSARRAEDLLSYLREGLGKLHAIPVTTSNAPTHMMTHWVHEGMEGRFDLGESCQLAGSKSDTTINVKNIDLQTGEVLAHIEGGLFVQKLALQFNQEVSFEMDDGMQIKKLRYENVVEDRVHDHAGESESARDYCLASILITGSLVATLIRDLIQELGGEKEFELEPS